MLSKMLYKPKFHRFCTIFHRNITIFVMPNQQDFRNEKI